MHTLRIKRKMTLFLRNSTNSLNPILKFAHIEFPPIPPPKVGTETGKTGKVLKFWKVRKSLELEKLSGKSLGFLGRTFSKLNHLSELIKIILWTCGRSKRF